MGLRTPLFYRVLLHLLPRRFREAHGAAMAETYVVARAQASRSGRWSVCLHALREAVDLGRTGLALRVRGWLGGARTSGRGSGNAGWEGARDAREPDRRRLQVTQLRDDVGFAVQSVTRHRLFFLFASLTLALGVGSTTAIYSALESVVLEPLPFPGGERMVIPWRTLGSSGGALLGLEPGQSAALAAEQDIFEAAATFYAGSMTLTGGSEPERMEIIKMGGDLAQFMGVGPVLGRLFSADERSGEGERVLLLSWGVWRRLYGGQRDVIGGSLELNGEPWTIIGVMPRDAVRPNGVPVPVDLWVPLPERDAFQQTVARLRPGVSVQQAGERVEQVVQRMSDGTFGGTVTDGTALRSGGLTDSLRLLMVAVSLLLLVACVNVSSLLLQRAVTRRQDTAVRAALGAGRARLVRQFLFESLALAVSGGILGIGFAYVAIRAMMRLRPGDLTALQMVRLDGSVVTLALGVSLAVGLMFGIMPALYAARARGAAALVRAPREGSASSTHFRWTLVGAEVALCFALLVGASLVIGSLRRLAQRDPGFRPDGLVVMDVRLPHWRYANAASRGDLVDVVAERIRLLPAVRNVAVATGVPPTAGVRFGRIEVPGSAAAPEGTLFFGGEVGVGFLGALGQPLVSGRDFQADDMQADPTPVILGEAAARRVFPDGDAVGRAFRFEGSNNTVIGVARDIRITGLGDDGSSLAGYWPLPRVRSEFSLLVRVAVDDPALLASLRDLVRAADADALVDVARMRDLLRGTIARQRFTTSLLAAFAVLALLLAAIGLYGVLAHVVSGRTHEIGVRVALGADARSIRSLVLRAGMLATLAGLGAGSIVAIVGLRLLGSELFGLEQNRPDAWLIAAALVTIVALAACWVPARRAARVDPVIAMRGD